MDEIDKKLLDITQNGLPMVSRPFLALAEKLKIEEREVIYRLESLKNKGYIRRMGGVFDSKKLGYCSTLCAISVPKNKVEYVSKVVNSYDEITHNYIRDHTYNMWFTIIAPSRERIEEIMTAIKKEGEVLDMIDLPAVRRFKVKASFKLSEV
ncbi:AsnC family transcriptional regulator [Clostridium sp. CX1]|uniref:siroheme decarboxylase n=1 Tax=Clostridium tanneri TaxID=3037988 RepID=A0ABU4JT88_9CLOT|nr:MULTISPECIES: AsnC family transcriptional regulator [unclassified Clostridium]MCT8975385.1 AsnC family transcriptional regulator [Clostridium sp. CX1]MDW8801384.1 AsnC family transcriptional regulator [Clostridium sp. A1-XYC3]